MPNHVTTKCEVRGNASDVVAFRAKAFTTNSEGGKPYEFFDFGKFVPMPDAVPQDDTSSDTPNILAILIRSHGIAALWQEMRRWDREDKLGDWKGLFGYGDGEIEERLEAFRPGCVARARAMARCYAATGYKDWYDWSVANWGSKWNSYQLDIKAAEPLSFEFQSAWSFPTPVFEAIAKQHPELSFHCLTFDEGWNFAGEGWFNPAEGERPFSASKEQATDELYERVYGHPPKRDDDDEDAA